MTTDENTYSTVYKITFPNGKIYIGQDVTDTIFYIGSWKREYVAADFEDLSREQRRDLTLRKEILWEEKGAEKSKVNEIETQFILQFASNNPEIGYNLKS
jgi:hypothetical protein